MKKTSSKKSSFPQISVIIAGFNAEKYLPACLDSILGQTFKDIEVILVNDASEDSTAELMQNFAAKHQNIHFIDNAVRRGVSSARNQGLDVAHGEYIMFCDADDTYSKEMCDHLLSAIRDSGAELAVSEANIIYHAHREMKPSDDAYYSLKYSGLEEMCDGLALNTDLSVQTKIFRRAIIEDNQLRFPEGLYYEDAYFATAYFCLCQNVYYLPERLYNYIRHHRSTMSDTFGSSGEDHAIDHLEVAFLLYRFLEEHQLLETYQTLFWETFLSFEQFAVNFSKTPARRVEVRERATSFIHTHEASLNQISVDLRQRILDYNSGNLGFNSSRLKRIVLKFLPTLRLTISNVLASRLALKRAEENLRRVNRDLSREYFKHAK